MTPKEFIKYEQSLELKELGFDEPCLATYQYPSKTLVRADADSDGIKNSNLFNFISAPLYQQAFSWFRQKYSIDGFVQIEPLNKKYGYVTYDRKKGNYTESERKYTSEQAELECLKKLIEIVKNK